MLESRDSANRLAEYSRVLGTQFGPVYYALENEYFWLRLKWQEYVALFGSSARVQILNEAAPAYFQMLEDALSDDILIHMARLTDPARTFSKENLTLQALPSMAPYLSDVVSTALEATEFARDWRNRRLAHRDLAVALGSAVRPILPATRDSIETALSAFHEVFARISADNFGAQLEAEVVEAPGSALDLLYVLRDGVEYRRRLLERFDARDLTSADLDPLPD